MRGTGSSPGRGNSVRRPCRSARAAMPALSVPPTHRAELIAVLQRSRAQTLRSGTGSCGSSARAPCSAAANSSTVGHRAPGSRASARSITAAGTAASAGTSDRIDGASLPDCCASSARPSAPFERSATGERRERRDAERIDIGPRIRRRTDRLLGTHVVHRAHRRADRGVALADGGDAEVGHERAVAPLFEEDVVGLDVAMDHAARMRVRNRPTDLLHHPQRLRHRQRAARAESLAERLAAARTSITKKTSASCDSTAWIGTMCGWESLGGGARLAEEALAETEVVGRQRRAAGA